MQMLNSQRVLPTATNSPRSTTFPPILEDFLGRNHSSHWSIFGDRAKSPWAVVSNYDITIVTMGEGAVRFARCDMLLHAQQNTFLLSSRQLEDAVSP